MWHSKPGFSFVTILLPCLGMVTFLAYFLYQIMFFARYMQEGIPRELQYNYAFYALAQVSINIVTQIHAHQKIPYNKMYETTKWPIAANFFSVAKVAIKGEQGKVVIDISLHYHNIMRKMSIEIIPDSRAKDKWIISSWNM